MRHRIVHRKEKLETGLKYWETEVAADLLLFRCDVSVNVTRIKFNFSLFLIIYIYIYKITGKHLQIIVKNVIYHFCSVSRSIKSPDIHEHTWRCTYPASVYQCLWSILGILRQDGHSVIRPSHLVVAGGLLEPVGTPISLSPPTSITLFQVSYWSTSGQKSYVYFLFFLTANFWWKIEFDAQGQDGKLGKIAYFPPIQPFATLSNEWQNKISVGDASLCWVAGLAI